MCFLWGCDSLSGEIRNPPLEILCDACNLIKVVLTWQEFYYYNYIVLPNKQISTYICFEKAFTE